MSSYTIVSSKKRPRKNLNILALQDVCRSKQSLAICYEVISRRSKSMRYFNLVISIESGPGPSPGFSSRRGQKPKRGANNQKGGHLFKIQYWMHAATGGPNVKWGAPLSNGGAGTTGPPAGDCSGVAHEGTKQRQRL